MYTSDEKGVLRSAILSGSETLDNNLALSGGDKSSVDYTTDNESCETIDVSRPLECGSFEKESKNPRISSLANMGVDTFHYPSDCLIDGKYIDQSIIYKEAIKRGKKCSLIMAGLGVGKSYSSKKLMTSHFKGKGVPVCHRVGLVHNQCNKKSFDAVEYTDVKRQVGGNRIDRVGSTIHSLPQVARIDRAADAFDDGLFVIDESESCAGELLTSTVKNEAMVLGALGDAYNRSGYTLCLDAHMGVSTIHMLNGSGVPIKDMLLVIVGVKELKGYSVDFYRDERGHNGKWLGKSRFINQIIHDLKKGMKLIVASLSADFCDELDREVRKAGFTDGLRKITSKTKDIERKAFTSEAYQDDVITMISPTMSTGISLKGVDEKDKALEDGETWEPEYNHADRCYVYASNNQGTGDYKDALQAMMRDRKVKTKNIKVLYRESEASLTIASRKALHQKEHDDALNELLTRYNIREEWHATRPNQDRVIAALDAIELDYAMGKLEFAERFIAECKDKGARVTEQSIFMLANGDVTYDSLKEEEARIKNLERERIADAFKITEDMELPDDDSDDVRAALDRKKVEDTAVIDFDELEEKSRLEWINQILPRMGGDLVRRIWEYERALGDRKKLNQVIKIGLVGVTDAYGFKRFAEKTRTDKAFWLDRAHFTRLALKDAGVSIDSNGRVSFYPKLLTEEDIDKRQSGLARSLSRGSSITKAKRCGMLNEYADSTKDFSQCVVEMMRNCGLKLRKSKGKGIWKIDEVHLKTVVDMLNRRRDAGIDETQARLDRIAEWKASSETRKAIQDEREFRTPERKSEGYEGLIISALSYHERSDLISEAIAYFEPFRRRWDAGMGNHTRALVMISRWLDNAS